VCVSYCPSGDPGPWGVWVCSLGALIGGRPPCELARVARGRPWHGLMRLRAAKAMEELKQVLGEVSFVGWAAHGSVPCGHRGWVRPPPLPVYPLPQWTAKETWEDRTHLLPPWGTVPVWPQW
jgi:hypothetical protein